ncbi:ATP-binding cassette domain-containing protein [Candidatus Roizmanbacteria bacterium]|nr:ATP-binding cassette domain-containing protein [Candidatus Roizmanbacteria bacterium]
MIVLSSVTKKFGPPTSGLTAINSISFKAQDGEIIGFLGPNGAGKTTTMRLILGYLYPTEGKVSINGLDPLENRIELLKQIGYLPENNPLYQEMKVDEYLKFVSAVKGADTISEVVSHVGLQEVLPKKIEELSRGFKQRVGLASALLGNPNILVLDEPTSGLDPLEQEKIKDLIKGFAKKKTVIFSTHILSEVEDVATKLIIINRGKIVYDGVKPKGKGAVEKLFKKLVKE